MAMFIDVDGDEMTIIRKSKNIRVTAMSEYNQKSTVVVLEYEPVKARAIAAALIKAADEAEAANV
jgi:hypothetical protein